MTSRTRTAFDAVNCLVRLSWFVAVGLIGSSLGDERFAGARVPRLPRHVDLLGTPALRETVRSMMAPRLGDFDTGGPSSGLNYAQKIST
jgi:hypothetical protein